MKYKVTDDSGSVPYDSLIPDQQKMNPIHQWTEPSDIHPFVEQFSELEDLFADHEIEYLKNNCENYPSSFDCGEFQELLDQIDLDEIRDKIDDEMYERKEKIGMFGTEEDIKHMITYLDENE